MVINLVGSCGGVSHNTLFIINQVLDAIVLLCVSAYAYFHQNMGALVPTEYEKHLRNILISVFVLFGVLMVVNVATFVRRRVCRFGNNVAFLSAKIALYIFVLSAIVLDYVYNDKQHRLLPDGYYALLTIFTIILIHLNALGLKACREDEKEAVGSMPETAMSN